MSSQAALNGDRSRATAQAAWRRQHRRTATTLWWRFVLQGGAIACVVLVVAALAGAVWMNGARFEPGAVDTGRTIALVGAWVAGLVALGFCLRWFGPMQLARRVETHDRGCDGLLLTAAEVAGSGKGGGSAHSAALRARLLQRAGAYLAAESPWRQRERGRRRTAGGVLVAVPVLAGLLLLLGPAWLGTGVGLLIDAGADVAAVNPYALRVIPGDVSVLEGSDQRIQAAPVGFDAQAVTLEVRTAASPDWQRTSMSRLDGSADFEAFLLGLKDTAEYRAVADGLASDVHRIEVVPRPRVARIDIEYRYPAHTGVPPRTVEDGGDIEAVAGTRVTLRVLADRPSGAARLNLGAAAPIELSADGEVWTAELTVRSDDSYRVELVALQGGDPAPASPEYRIAALADGLPMVSVARPGRDAKVSAVEEVEIQVDASDDVGVRALELVMSVNGGEERTVPLAAQLSPAAMRSEVHTVYLEDLDMEPGDLVAYYARARDSDRAERVVQSDIYFLEVRPFERRYRRARSGGGGGGGQRGGGDAMLAAQQKALVIALFKLVRDRDVLEAAEHGEQVDLLSGAQERIRERVDAIARRLGERSIVDQEPGYKQMAKELPLASEAMIRVEAMLTIADTARALPEARTALLHLQRADAAFREVQVAQASRGGGGGGRAQANDLANLFKLEMDSFKSQYAHVRRARPPQRAPEIDETMRRLEELARRQERALREAQTQLGGADGDGGAGGSRALLEQAEQILRTLERLSRKRPDPRLAQGAERMREAVEAMREARGGKGAGARAQQQAAIESLREAQRLLDQMGPARLADAVRAAAERARALESEQANVSRTARQAAASGEASVRALGEVVDAKQRMLGEVQQLQGEVDAAARQATKSSAEVATQLREAQAALKRGAVPGEIEQTGRALVESGAVALDPAREAAIGQSLRETRERLEAAAERAETGAVDRAEAARRLAEATRRLAQLRDGRAQPADGNEAGAGRRDAAGRDRPGSPDADGRAQAAAEDGRRQAAGQGQNEGQARTPGSGADGQAQADQARSGQGQEGQGQEGQGQEGQGQSGQAQAGRDGRGAGRAGEGRGARPGAGRSAGQGAPIGGVAAGGGNQRSGIALGGTFGGGRFGGPESNVDIGQLREGLRGSVDELRSVLRSFTPGALAAQDIESVVRGLEGLMDADSARLQASFPDLVATLQGIERRVRETESEPVALLNTAAEGTVPGRYRASVEDYFRRLGEAGDDADGSR